MKTVQVTAISIYIEETEAIVGKRRPLGHLSIQTWQQTGEENKTQKKEDNEDRESAEHSSHETYK